MITEKNLNQNLIEANDVLNEEMQDIVGGTTIVCVPSGVVVQPPTRND